MEMYKVHQDALLVPIQILSNDFVMGNNRIQAVSASASKDQSGKIHISLTNIDNIKSQEVEIDLKGVHAQQVTGRILTSSKVQDHNTFENPATVVPRTFKDVSISGDHLKMNMPPNSVIVLELGS
jgi:alpha-N-arabinofuranosidase